MAFCIWTALLLYIASVHFTSHKILMNTVNSVMRFLCTILPVFLLAGCALFVPIKKEPKIKLAVHNQTAPSDSARFAMPLKIPYAPYEIYLSRIPLISKLDVDRFRIYEADDGTYGALLYLKPHGEMALEQYTLANQRTYLVTFLNDRVVSTQLVDRPVRDGLFYIPNGLTAEDVEALQESFDEIGQTKIPEEGEAEESLNLGEEDDVFQLVGEEGTASTETMTGPDPFATNGGSSDEILSFEEEQQRRGAAASEGPEPVAEAGFDEAPPLPSDQSMTPRPRRVYERREPAAAPTEFYQPPFQ